MLNNQRVTGWWFGTFGLFFHISGTIIPCDFHIFQRGRYTTNQLKIFGNTHVFPMAYLP
jgi:hypothetical protein